MRPNKTRTTELYNDLGEKLNDFSHYTPLLGAKTSDKLDCLILQMIDSIKRVEYVTTLAQHPQSLSVADPNKPSFNPIRAALWHKSQNDVEEALWLIFLFVHFGKNAKSGWNLVKNVYGQLNSGFNLSWKTVSLNPQYFKSWLADNYTVLKQTGSFGNHRKYENLRADSSSGTAAVFESYIKWILSYGSHDKMLQHAYNTCNNDPHKTFNYLYNDMNKVHRFGRTAKFDYLTMAGKTGLANIVPEFSYMNGATGPLRGGRLLFKNNIEAKLSAKEIETNLKDLNEYLKLPFGMQVFEDSLCNWQKSPNNYLYFKG